MRQTFNTKEKLKTLINIFFPILVSQVCYMATHFIDSMMAGRSSSNELAGVGVGASIWIPFQVGLAMILNAVSPTVTNMLGAKKDTESIRKFTFQAFYIAFVLALIAILFGVFAFEPILSTFTPTPIVRSVAEKFFHFLMMGFIPMFCYMVIRSFFESHGKTKISMYINLLILPINAILNYIFIYGHLGVPKLGGAGTGLGTAISSWIVFLIAVIVLFKHSHFKKYQLFNKMYAVDWVEWKRLLKIGIPSSFAVFFEVGIFSAVSLLMSGFSTNVIAAHLAALNFSSLLYMVPLSISITMTIAIGFENGAKRYVDAKKYSQIGLMATIIFSIFSAAILYLVRNHIAVLYATDPKVIALISHFLVYALLFQLSDAVQGAIQGMLRGYKDVKFTAFVTFIGYWIIGLPTGHFLARFTSFGPYGYWIGFIVGLSVCAIGLFTRLKRLEKKLSVSEA